MTDINRRLDDARIVVMDMTVARSPDSPDWLAQRHPDGERILRRFEGGWTGVSLEAGQLLFTEGDPADLMYIVRVGAVRVLSGDIVYEDVGPGGVVGEMGLIEQHIGRSATALALVETELVAIGEERFLFLVGEAPEFAMMVLRVLARRLRVMNRRYQSEAWTPSASAAAFGRACPDNPPRPRR